MDNRYIRETVFGSLNKDEEDMFDSNNPIEWYDGQIRNVFYTEDDECMVEIRSEGGENETVPKKDIIQNLRQNNKWEEDQIDQFEEELEDMADD